MTTGRSNPARPNPAGEAALESAGRHARTQPVPVGDGAFAVACRCGWYEDSLPSKRRAHRAMTLHLEDAGSLAHELDTSQGRGRLAARARERALELLTARHALELAELEEAERVKLGLPPTLRTERTA